MFNVVVVVLLCALPYYSLLSTSTWLAHNEIKNMFVHVMFFLRQSHAVPSPLSQKMKCERLKQSRVITSLLNFEVVIFISRRERAGRRAAEEFQIT